MRVAFATCVGARVVDKPGVCLAEEQRNAVTTSFNRFDLVIQAFHKTTVEAVNKVAGYFI